MPTRFTRALAFSAWFAALFGPWSQAQALPEEGRESPWWHPSDYFELPGLETFLDRLERDKSWVEAEWETEGPTGIPQRIHALRDRASGAYYVYANGDMRWVVHSGRLRTNQSQSLVQGYNIGAKGFILEGKLHTLGGYGLWQRHFNLLRFEGGAEAWQLIASSGWLPEERLMDRSMLYPTGDGLVMVFDNVFNRSNPGDDHLGYVLRALDVNRREWDVLGVLDPRLGDLWHCTGLGAGLAMSNAAGELVWFDFESMTARLVAGEGLRLEAFWNWHNGLGRMTFRSDSSAWHEFQGEVLSLDLPWRDLQAATALPIVDVDEPLPSRTGEVHGMQSPTPDSSGGVSPWWLVALGGLAVLAVGGLVFQVAMRRQIRVAQSHRFSPMTSRVLASGRAHLETEELDAILGIAHLNTPETLRSQRARLIARINTEYHVVNGHELIVRSQNQEDRRRSLYLIQPTATDGSE